MQPRRRLDTARALSLFLIAASAHAAAPDCLDTEAALDYWRPVREKAATTELPADELAPELVGCLGSPDPELRDRIGYELFTYWLRQGKLGDATRAALLETLQTKLAASDSGAVLARSFSALILAEVLRSDAAAPFMSAAQRQSLLESAAKALAAETDFRGLDAEIGWVHPVAHMADLLWRFALHPATTAQQGRFLLEAVRVKVAPTETSYVFNEGDRLARVVATVIRRQLVSPDAVAGWLGSFHEPRSMAAWSQAFQSPAGMAELHNTKQFLRAVSDQLQGEEVDPKIAEALSSLVRGLTELI